MGINVVIILALLALAVAGFKEFMDFADRRGWL
jgi:hypothetical protein